MVVLLEAIVSEEVFFSSYLLYTNYKIVSLGIVDSSFFQMWNEGEVFQLCKKERKKARKRAIHFSFKTESTTPLVLQINIFEATA